jgi:hypothetical protein
MIVLLVAEISFETLGLMHVPDDRLFQRLRCALIICVGIIALLDLRGRRVEGEEREEVMGNVVLSISLDIIAPSTSRLCRTWKPDLLKKM